MKPKLRQLEYLIALKNTGSFSAAAEIMHVTQSTLSAGIKELEEALGQPLARRGKRSLTLTPFGEEVLDSAKDITQSIDALVQKSRTLKQPLTGPLRLGIIPTIAPYVLPKILPALQNEFPNLELQIFEDLSERITENLTRGTLDLIMLALPYKTTGHHQTALWDEEFLYATTRAPGKKQMHMSDIDPSTLLVLEDGHCLRDHALDSCQLALPQTRKTFSATSLSTLIQMVAAGYGATLLPKMACETAPPQSITLTPFHAPKPTRTIGLAWSTAHPKIKDFEILVKMIKNTY